MLQTILTNLLQKMIQEQPSGQNTKWDVEMWYSYTSAVFNKIIQPSDVHANSYPHRGNMLQYFEMTLPLVGSLWSS